MNTLLLVWRASLRSSSNAFRRDGRARVGMLFALSIQVVSGVWACWHLLPTLASWWAAGELADHLWLTCLAAWAMIALFSILATFQYGLNGNEALLLATQPIVLATRLRALYGLVVFKGCGSWLLWETGVLGVALAPIRGWSTFIWLALLIVGATLVAWLALVATLLVMCFIVPHLRAFLGLLVGLVILFGLLFVVQRAAHWPLPPGIAKPLLAPSPVLVLLIVGLLIVIALLPLAHFTGKLYLSALLISQNHADTNSALAIPGTRLLLAQLARSRTMTAALLSKGLLNQSRHLLAWARVLMLVVFVVLFAPIRAALAPLHLAPPLLVAGYATLLAALMLFEYAPYALSSEGSRLALYLVLPRGIPSFLRARLCSFLFPALLVGLPATLLLDLWTGLSPLDLCTALLLVILALSGYTTFTVLGSALDEDLALPIEDRAQALMQEELPITPHRLRLLSLTIALLAALFLLTWKLPLLLALPALALLDGAIALLMWRLSTAYLAQLVR
jgi:hypothetical protein